MEALRDSYGDSAPDTDTDSESPQSASTRKIRESDCISFLPPPPHSLLNPPNTTEVARRGFQAGQPSRVRSFPHVKGNYALHVYIPVNIPSSRRKTVMLFLKRIASVMPGLYLVDRDVSLEVLCKEDNMLEAGALGRVFHISLGRTVPIRVHQIDSVVSMLRQKIRLQKQYLIGFRKWEIFTNDDYTRTFLSAEVLARGFSEIRDQIEIVNKVYRHHNLPEFYKDPRPHISLAWALGDISRLLKRAVDEEMKSRSTTSTSVSSDEFIFTTVFSGIECKIGKKIHRIC